MKHKMFRPRRWALSQFVASCWFSKLVSLLVFKTLKPWLLLMWMMFNCLFLQLFISLFCFMACLFFLDQRESDPPTMAPFLHLFPMTTNRLWKVMSWNVRGLNFDKKWNSIRDKILESKSDIVYLQETKKESFDLRFIKNICPRDFTLLCSSHQWEPHGGYWLFGKEQWSLELRFFRMILLSLQNILQSSIMVVGS